MFRRMSVCEFLGGLAVPQDLFVEEELEDLDNLLLQSDIDNLEFELYELNRVIEEYCLTIQPEDHSL